jgi:hypothetical protein
MIIFPSSEKANVVPPISVSAGDKRAGAAIVKMNTGSEIVVMLISCDLKTDTEDSMREHVMGFYPNSKILGIEIVPDGQRPTEEELEQIKQGIPNQFKLSQT